MQISLNSFRFRFSFYLGQEGCHLVKQMAAFLNFINSLKAYICKVFAMQFIAVEMV